MNETRRLNEDDIKELKIAKRPAVMFCVIAVFGLIGGNLIYILTSIIDQDILLYGNIIGFTIAFSAPMLFNRKYRKDEESGVKNLSSVIIQSKLDVQSWEAGSGAVGPVGMAMKETRIRYLVITNIRYEVDEIFFANVNEGDEVFMYHAPYSNYFLGFSVP